MVTRLFILILVFAGMGCQSANPFNCPTPELVKLRKAKAKRLKYAMAKRKEAMANRYDYFQVNDTKSLNKIEEWDCPKPGLKHNKMVAKKAKDLQRRYAKNQKKVAKESEDRTVMVNPEDH